MKIIDMVNFKNTNFFNNRLKMDHKKQSENILYFQ